MSSPKKAPAIATLLAVTATLWGCAMQPHSQEQGNSAMQKQDRRGPPQEAFDACAGLTENASCSVTTPRGDATGSCVIARGDAEKLVCMPEGMEKKLRQ